MKKEYIKPIAELVERLEAYCAVISMDSSGYGNDHSTIFDDLDE